MDRVLASEAKGRGFESRRARQRLIDTQREVARWKSKVTTVSLQMPNTNEAFSRIKIDAQLRDQGWGDYEDWYCRRTMAINCQSIGLSNFVSRMFQDRLPHEAFAFSCRLTRL